MKMRSVGLVMLALSGVAGAALTAGPAAAQAGKALPPLKASLVRPSPIHVLPVDAADDAGLEQAEAMAVPAVSTLNAQYASLTTAPPPALAATPAEAPADQPEAAAAPPPGPSVAIARRIIDAAGAFNHYMRQASAIRATFGDGEAVTRALETGATYEQTQIEAGAIAYGALAALQEPSFVATLSELAPDPAAREAVIRQLIAEPEAVMQAPGARRAAARAAGAIGQMGGSLFTSGAAVKQAAYDVQHQAWSRTAILAPQVELARIKSQSAARFALKSEDTAALMNALVASRSSGESAVVDGPVSPMVAHALALAALAVMGGADEAHADQIAPLLTEAKSAECVKMARLNLYQCLSVAGPEYEDVFCLGQHAMIDTAQCVVQASGYAAPVAPGSVAVPVAGAPESPPAVMVPIALAAAPGH
jgi:hypothetical protein